MKERLISFFRTLYPLPKVSGLEALLARALLAWVIFHFFPFTMGQTTQPLPVGLANWFDLTWMADAEKFTLYRQVFFWVLVAYASGVGLPLVLPVLTVMHILPFTLYNSQGYTHHGYQIISLTLLGQSLTVLWFAVRGRSGILQPSRSVRDWLLFNSQLVIACAYLVSVCSKIIRSKGRWFGNSYYIALDCVKTMRQNFYNNLDPQFAVDPPLVKLMLENRVLTTVFFDAGVLLEAAMILFIGKRMWTFLVGIALIIMHRVIAQLMGLHFITHEAMVAVYWINLPFIVSFVLMWAWHQAFKRRSPAELAA